MDAARFQFANAAQRFVLDALPWRDPESTDALRAFVRTASALSLSPADADTILLQCLIALERHAGGRMPSLVERYIIENAEQRDEPLEVFSRCVCDLLTYRSVNNPLVRAAIAIIERRFHDLTLREESVAAELHVQPTSLSSAFHKTTRFTFTAYVRNVRLDRAAALLTTTLQSIKEIWSSVGFNDASNFNHDFKKKFGVAPSEYRLRAAPSVASRSRAIVAPEASGLARHNDSATKVLIVDDDDDACVGISRWLRLEGFSTATASNGERAIAQVERFDPDVMLLDLHMPLVDGLTCLRRLRDRHSRRPSVAILTGDWYLDDVRDEILKLHATIVFKPCFVDRLQNLVSFLASDPSLRS